MKKKIVTQTGKLLPKYKQITFETQDTYPHTMCGYVTGVCTHVYRYIVAARAHTCDFPCIVSIQEARRASVEMNTISA